MRSAAPGLLLVLIGCSGLPGTIVSSLDPGGLVTLPRPIRVVRADGGDCGVEALKAVLDYYGRPADPAALREALRTPGVEGTLPHKLIQAARANGLRSRMVDGSIERLKKAIDGGVPAVIMIRIREGANHFLVACAYTPRHIVFGFYDARKWLLSPQELAEVWAPCGRLQLELIPDASAGRLDRARRLESEGEVDEALKVYRDLLNEDPARMEARIGAANCLALSGSYAEARKEYLKALEDGSEDPELLNNLADVTLALGLDPKSACRWAQMAVDGYRKAFQAETADLARAIAARKLALALGTLGSARLATGDVHGAQACFEESLGLLPETQSELRSRRLRQIADCCERLGDKEKAARLRDEADR